MYPPRRQRRSLGERQAALRGDAPRRPALRYIDSLISGDRRIVAVGCGCRRQVAGAYRRRTGDQRRETIPHGWTAPRSAGSGLFGAPGPGGGHLGGSGRPGLGQVARLWRMGRLLPGRSARAAGGWALRTGYSAAARSENSGSGGGTPALEVSPCTRYAWTGMATFGSARRATGLVASTRGPPESSGSTRLTASPRNTHLRWLWIHRSGSGRRPRQGCSWRSFPRSVSCAWKKFRPFAAG